VTRTNNPSWRTGYLKDDRLAAKSAETPSSPHHILQMIEQNKDSYEVLNFASGTQVRHCSVCRDLAQVVNHSLRRKLAGHD
jgi:hypothetical protein